MNILYYTQHIHVFGLCRNNCSCKPFPWSNYLQWYTISMQHWQKKKNLNSCQRKSKVRYAVWWSSIGKMTVHVVLSYLPQIYWEPWWLKVSNSFHHIRFCGIYDLLHLLYWKDGICLNIYAGNHNVNLQSTLIPVCSLK